MSAFVALRFKPDLKQSHNLRIDNGKHVTLAVTTIMSKLVIHTNALLHDDRIWIPKASLITMEMPD
ncbi:MULTISPECIES: hypothetical protein [Komagataeibacter]|uniref:Uncharacterized protein n=1 Tax=Komagataeibacter oboediens TaxID=65958 RepID=A0A318QKE2_9PROT|nr:MULTISPECIES: hypothetical protein [Komagataeibacter]AZV40649.1 hypothetical protein CXP35_17365 [Komagataeibacter xylinus]MBV1824903.1 hypothetical protein [Komagataeibacter oboediens]PYD77961.1 hypothetical protein CFR80_17130 [Komagataeibacter oboediens]WEQ50761.1 hypothetical protein LV478_01785 [Komagataeibacter oboediens]